MLVTISLIISISSFACAWNPSYNPAYCTKNVATRQIPSLTTSQQSQVESLVQVQTIIRHGARTPYGKYSCWKDYDVVWNNCNVTELMLESPSLTSPARSAPWLFRKIYDAYPNLLGGNCYTGQLVSEGYEQEQALGTYLYQAYINSDLPLFSTNMWTDISTDKEIYLRSDDEQRTIMSGQLLVHGMFNVTSEVIVPWHTGDYSLDQIYPNSQVCPKLDALSAQVYATPEWLAYNTSQFVTTLDYQLNTILGEGYWSWDYIYDCMLTTVCTGRGLPGGNADTVLMNDTIFNNTLYQIEYSAAYLNLYNNSQWAKLSMANTAWHVRTNLENVINNASTGNYKFALFSGHDTTVQPFLAAVLKENWDQQWPAYAAMVTIELYEALAGGYLFRMVYNGEAMIVPGCPDTLCDVNVLINALAFGEENPDCSVSSSDVNTDDDGDNNCNDSSSNMSATDWTFITILSSILGALVGGAVVVFVDKHRKGVMLGSSAAVPLLGDGGGSESSMHNRDTVM